MPREGTPVPCGRRGTCTSVAALEPGEPVTVGKCPRRKGRGFTRCPSRMRTRSDAAALRAQSEPRAVKQLLVCWRLRAIGFVEGSEGFLPGRGEGLVSWFTVNWTKPRWE